MSRKQQNIRPLPAIIAGLLLLPGAALAQDGGPPTAGAAAAAPTGGTPLPSGGTPVPGGGPAIPTGGFGGPTAGVQPGAEGGAATGGMFGGGLAFEQVDEDFFTTIDLASEFGLGPVRVGLWVPLRLRVIDEDPQNEGLLREADWDEPSDYMKLLRFVELVLQEETWRFRGRYGAQDGESIGHGTLLAGYYNSIDRDHYQAGLVLSSAIRYGGVELLLDNLVQPDIFGTRVHVRPGTFFTDADWASRFATGLSLVGDADAPLQLEPNAEGRPAVGEDNEFLFSTDGVYLLGLDAEYTLVQNDLLDIIPYADLNFLMDADTGVGLHLGSFFNARLSALVTLMTRLEYRLSDEDYVPRYIDNLYEVQRVQYDPGSFTDPASGLPLTKLAWLRQTSSGTHGWMGELFLTVLGLVRVGGTYEDAEGPDNSAITLSLLLPAISSVQAGGMYTRRGFDGFSEAFDLDGALLIAWARMQVAGPLYVTGSYSRTWHIQSDNTYESEDDFSVGLGVAFNF